MISEVSLKQAHPESASISSLLCMRKTLTAVSYATVRMIKQNSSNALHYKTCSIFDCKTVPDISIEKYLCRIMKYVPHPPECVVTALIYVDRLNRHRPEFIIDYYNVHRIIIASLSVAFKFHCDVLFDNRYYAQLGGIPAKELRYLEFNLLKLLDYDIVVNKEELNKYIIQLNGLGMQNPKRHAVLNLRHAFKPRKNSRFSTEVRNIIDQFCT